MPEIAVESKGLNYVLSKGWDFQQSGSEHIKIRVCPYCANANHKFFINISGTKSDGLHDCKVCSEAGNLTKLMVAQGDRIAGVVSMQDAAQYSRTPEAIPNIALAHKKLMDDADTLDYLVGTRGFAVSVIEDYKLGLEIQGEEKWLLIPYLHKGNCVFVKYRSLPPAKKAFRSLAGREAPLFNEDVIETGLEEITLVEGECLTGDTEVLTPEGWVRLDEYSGQKVAQWTNDETATFVKPLAYIKKDYTGELINFTSSTKSIDLETTPKHRVLFNSRITNKNIVQEANDVPKGGNVCFYRTANLTTDGINIEESDLRMWVAIQADATLSYVSTTENIDVWAFEFSKDRKIDRCKLLLRQCGLSYTETITKRGTTKFRVKAERGRYGKVFPKSFYSMSQTQREVFREEVGNWDAHKRKNGKIMYLSCVKDNADMVQWAFSMSGIYAKQGICKRLKPRHDIYLVSVNVQKVRGRQNLTCGSFDKVSRQFSGKVYCVQVPSSFIITRRNYAVCITGNCDTLSCLSQGIDKVVGIPGANIKKAVWIKRLNDVAPKKIYILYDNDKVGQKAAKEMAKRIGLSKVYNILLPDFQAIDGSTGKDINEWFRAGHTLEEFQTLKTQSTRFDVDGVTNLNLALDELQADIEERGTEPTLITPWESLNKKLGGMEWGDLVGVIAQGKVGKSTMCLNWLDYYSAIGLPSMFYCLEMTPKRLARKWCSFVTETDDTPGASKICLATIKKAKSIAAGRAGDLLFAYSRGGNKEEVFDTIRQAVSLYGVKVVCFDNLQLLCRSIDHAPQETSVLTKSFKDLAMELGIVIILVVQPNRVKEGDIVAASNSMGSSAIEKDVDSMIVLHRKRIAQIKDAEFMGFMDTDSTFEPNMFVKVDLNRYGPGGITTLLMEGHISRVREFNSDELNLLPKQNLGGIATETVAV